MNLLNRNILPGPPSFLGPVRGCTGKFDSKLKIRKLIALENLKKN